MPETINILHVSDLHARVGLEMYLETRVRAMLEDVERLNIQIDAIIFTGDLAFSGKEEEYALADRLLLSPLKSRFLINKQPVPVYIIPGNHDIDRGRIDPMVERGLLTELTGSQTAVQYLDHKSYTRPRLQAFYDYRSRLLNHDFQPFYCSVQHVKGIDIGFACLNSAWRCSGTEDEKHLFLTEEQIYSAYKAVENCVVKIALVHHPLNWLHPSEYEAVVHDLKRNFDIVAKGHLHVQDSMGEITPNSDCILFSAPALCDGRLPDAGYNIYCLDYENKKVVAKYRKFIRRRNQFDKDTDYAQDGEQAYPLASNDLTRHSLSLLSQRLVVAGTALGATLRQSLSVYQQKADPIYVTPALQSVTFNQGQEVCQPFRDEFSSMTRNHCILYGAPETGKTVLSHAIGAAINQASAQSRESRLAVYVDLEDKKAVNIEKQIIKGINETIVVGSGSASPNEVVVFLDHVDKTFPSHIADIEKLIETHPNWRFIVSTTNYLHYKTYALGDTKLLWSYFRLDHWGPSRIREFISKFFDDDSVDVDAAFDFVTRSLKNTDLPNIPMVIVLYLTVFQAEGSKYSSLSFLDLLIKYEHIRLEQGDQSAANSIYNKERILSHIAVDCLKQNQIGLPRKQVEDLIRSYFDDKALSVNSNDFINSLSKTGMVEVTDESFTFKYFVFFDYYLARAFKEQIIQVETLTQNLPDCIQVANALALYGGLFRENIGLVKHLFSLIENSFQHQNRYTLADLDQYVDGLLLDHIDEEQGEAVENADITSRPNYDEMDEEFSEGKNTYRKERENGNSVRENEADLGYLFEGLKAFYNLFRNLENIERSNKVELLDRILDYHIKLTFDLIEFFHSLFKNKDITTIMSYVIALAFQDFLTTNIGNQNLKITIEDALKRCNNDFKEMLLLFLYADLRLPGHERKLEDFVKRTSSDTAVEMVFFKLRMMMVNYEKTNYPAALSSAFRVTFGRRVKLWSNKAKPEGIDRAFGQVLDDTRKEQRKNLSNKEQ